MKEGDNIENTEERGKVRGECIFSLTLAAYIYLSMYTSMCIFVSI